MYQTMAAVKSPMAIRRGCDLADLCWMDIRWIASDEDWNACVDEKCDEG